MASRSTSVLSVRVSSDEKAVLQRAADESRASISEFIRRSALDAAEDALMARTRIVIPPEGWAEIEALMEAPSEAVPELWELAGRTPPWRR